jgi:putative transcriptional regulator
MDAWRRTVAKNFDAMAADLVEAPASFQSHACKADHFRLIDHRTCPILKGDGRFDEKTPRPFPGRAYRAGGTMPLSTLTDKLAERLAEKPADKRERGFLDGQFVIAMPGRQDGNFSRSVVYICAHSPAGAMGFIINRAQSISFPEILLHLKMVDQTDAIMLPSAARDFPILNGGPVETGRGFVLHSDDYLSDSSIPVSDDISLTATLDIVRAISEGRGPVRATMLLGYAGWGPGQLEAEIGANGWLNCPADEELIFDRTLDDKYERALGLMGVRPEMLSSEAGHA